MSWIKRTGSLKWVILPIAKANTIQSKRDEAAWSCDRCSKLVRGAMCVSSPSGEVKFTDQFWTDQYQPTDSLRWALLTMWISTTIMNCARGYHLITWTVTTFMSIEKALDRRDLFCNWNTQLCWVGRWYWKTSKLLYRTQGFISKKGAQKDLIIYRVPRELQRNSFSGAMCNHKWFAAIALCW